MKNHLRLWKGHCFLHPVPCKAAASSAISRKCNLWASATFAGMASETNFGWFQNIWGGKIVIATFNPFETVSLYLVDYPVANSYQINWFKMWLVGHWTVCHIKLLHFPSSKIHIVLPVCCTNWGQNVTKEHPGENCGRVQISKMHQLCSKEAGCRFAKCASGYLQCVGAKVRKKLHGADESGSATSVPL